MRIICYRMGMRIMGIDYGSKRVGVAVSDEAGQFALPVVVLKNSKTLLADVVGLAKTNAVKDIVLGESRDYKGKPNAIFEAAEGFRKELEAAGFTVHLQLEFMTSVAAERFQGKNDKSDASAAALILQSYLDAVQSRS